MDRQSISTSGAPAAIGPYSQAVRVGNWLFVSGQIPLDAKTGELVLDNISEQTEKVLENLATIIKSADFNLKHVVKTTVYLADLTDFAEYNRIYAKYFSENQPARATIQAGALPKGARIEIDAICIK
jgi:2-iminobutanoate/2-iminopropanoate deaminase